MEELTIDLQPVTAPSQGGEFRSRDNQHFARPELLIENDEKPVVVKATLLRAVRGTLDPSGSPATLMHFQFSFRGPQSRRVMKATVRITFQDRDGPNEADPVVHKISADDTFALNPRVDNADVNHTFNAGLNAEMAGVGGNLGYSYSIGKKMANKHSATLIGNKLRNKSVGNETVARWEMIEDPATDDGVPTLLNVAVVLCHELAEQYRFSVEIDTTHKGWLFFYGGVESRMISPLDINSTVLNEDTEYLGGLDLDGAQYLSIKTSRPLEV